MKIDDAGSEGVAARHDGVRDERFASSLEAVEQPSIECVQLSLWLWLASERPQGGGDVAKHGDAQVVTDEFQIRVLSNGLGKRLRQPNVVRDHRAISRRADMLQREPDLERAKSTRVLHAEVEEVGRPVPMTRNGRSPATRSASICARSRSTSMRRAASRGIHRIAEVPNPLRSAAFSIQVWVSAEQ
jgi:hypothetical protein